MNKPKRPRIESAQPEYGDVRDVQRIFGIKETMLYQLMNEGRIKAVSIKVRGKTRGKRLFSFDSIRQLLAGDQPEEEPKPGIHAVMRAYRDSQSKKLK